MGAVTSRESIVRRRAVVTGTVQGVGFRWSTRAEAHRLGVTGWARNRSDGSVEVEVEGEPGHVALMIDWLRSGPPGSTVVDVRVTEAVPDGDDAFRIRLTE